MSTRRGFQILLIVSALGLSWLGMMALHELGHVLHAWLTGGAVEGLVLHPLAISRTDVSPNPQPLCVAWGGAIWGCLLPLGLFVAMVLAARRCAWLGRWFAGFCLVVNGAYLAGGAVLSSRGGGDDPGTLLEHGAARWQLIAFGLPAIAIGLYLWNGLGPHFGLGDARGEVDRRVAVGVLLAWVMVVAMEFAFGRCG
jgi:hypothetical protein